MVFEVLVLIEPVYFELMDSPVFLMTNFFILSLNFGCLLQSIIELLIDLGSRDIFVGLKCW